MSRFYEEKLPEGYSKAMTVDAEDRKIMSRIKLIAMISQVILIPVFFFVYAFARLQEIGEGITTLKCIIFVLAYFLYIVLHELTHGLVYKVFTGKKLTFGFKPPYAFCGVPDIYTYRITSMMSLFAPLTVFSIVYVLLFFIISDPFSKTMILLMLALHVSGCSGDIYGIGLYLFKFRSPKTLRNDSGSVQVYYTKD